MKRTTRQAVRGLAEEQAEVSDFDSGFGALWARALSEQLGFAVHSQAELVRRVTRAPLPLSVVDSLSRFGWQQSEIFSAVIPRRTFALRRSQGQATLTAEETDRAIRAARVVALAEAVFEDRGKALAWLRKPKSYLDDLVLMSVLGLSEPARLIEDRLLQLEHGMAA